MYNFILFLNLKMAKMYMNLYFFVILWKSIFHIWGTYNWLTEM